MKGTKAMRMIVLLLSGALSTSCMHLGMMGVDDTHHAGSAQEPMENSVLEKEVIVGDVKAVAVFPPLEQGEDIMLTLRLTDAGTASSISGAEVHLRTQHAHLLVQGNNENHPSHVNEGRDYDDVDQDVAESQTPGVYVIGYRTPEPGEYTLTFSVAAIGDRKLDPGITIAATRTVPGEFRGHRSGMMSGMNTTTYVVIGAAVMGAMMIAMIMARGRMF